VVWLCNWRACVLPASLLLGSVGAAPSPSAPKSTALMIPPLSAVAALGGAHQQSLSQRVSSPDAEVAKWGTAFGVLTLSTNLSCTALIGIRAWSVLLLVTSASLFSNGIVGRTRAHDALRTQDALPLRAHAAGPHP
jgi:hypothetical protein